MKYQFERSCDPCADGRDDEDGDWLVYKLGFRDGYEDGGRTADADPW